MTAWFDGMHSSGRALLAPGFPSGLTADLRLGEEAVWVSSGRTAIDLSWSDFRTDFRNLEAAIPVQDPPGHGWWIGDWDYGSAGLIGIALRATGRCAAAVSSVMDQIRRDTSVGRLPSALGLDWPAHLTMVPLFRQEDLGTRMESDRQTAQALCWVLSQRRDLRARLTDGTAVSELVSDLRARPQRFRQPPGGIRPSTADVLVASRKAGLVHPFTRPIAGEVLVDREEAVRSVLARLRRNPYVTKLPDTRHVQQLLDRFYFDVEPWPFGALLGIFDGARRPAPARLPAQSADPAAAAPRPDQPASPKPSPASRRGRPRTKPWFAGLSSDGTSIVIRGIPSGEAADVRVNAEGVSASIGPSVGLFAWSDFLRKGPGGSWSFSRVDAESAWRRFAAVALLVGGTCASEARRIDPSIGSPSRRPPFGPNALLVNRPRNSEHVDAAEITTLNALCAVLSSRRQLRAALRDADRVARLAHDLRAHQLAYPSEHYGLLSSSVDISIAIEREGYDHPFGRPIGSEVLVDRDEAVVRVVARLRANPFWRHPPVEDQVRRLLDLKFFDVEPWPFAALTDP